MRTFIKISSLVAAILVTSCGNGQTETTKKTLSATEFSEVITKNQSAQVVDVRTPEEFSEGHIRNAQNFNWNGSDFDTQISMLDKSKPVYVYCLSGARSAAAAKKMREDGFQEVYELEGGISKWRSAGLPETISVGLSNGGMTKQEFDALLDTDKTALVDFYADWCKPCQKMEPYLDEISKEMADSVLVIRINADDNSELCKVLEIDALPALKVYKNKIQTWSNTGFIEKQEIVLQM